MGRPNFRRRRSPAPWRASIVRLATAFAAVASLSVAHAVDACPAREDGRLDLHAAAAILEPGLALPAAFGTDPDLRPWAEVQRPRPSAAGGGGRSTRPDADRATDPERPSEASLRAAWRAAADAYGVPSPEVRDGAVDPEWVRRAAGRVQVVGIRLVDDRSESGGLAAVGAYWNSPLLPRLRLVPIGDGPQEEATRTAFERLGTCALAVDAWVDVPVTVAERLLDASDEPLLFAFGPDAGDAQGWSAWFARDRIAEAFAFRAPEVADVDEFAAVFAGGRPSWAQLVRSVPSLRGSLGPGAIVDLLRGAVFR